MRNSRAACDARYPESPSPLLTLRLIQAIWCDGLVQLLLGLKIIETLLSALRELDAAVAVRPRWEAKDLQFASVQAGQTKHNYLLYAPECT